MLVVDLNFTTDKNVVELEEEFALSWEIKNIDFATCDLSGSGIDSIDLQNQNSVVLFLSEAVDHDYQLTCGEIVKTITISGTKYASS